MAGNRAKLSGNNITGVSGAQHGAQKNAQAMQRAGAAGQANFEFGSELGATGAAGGLTAASFGVGAGNAKQKNAKAMQKAGRAGQ